MCTLSFLPRPSGYVVAMNRDERLSRVEALPPRRFEFSGTTAIYPHEPGGGTWIAVNERRMTLALLNLGDSSGRKHRSRGEIIPALVSSGSSAEVGARLRGTDLAGVLPFRLIGIFGGERRILEWRWDGWALRRRSFAWRRQHWFSSGISDERARRGRAPAFESAWRRRSAGALGWLRGMHRSHQPAPGPFSVCVHRPDAGTRSYTEIVCDAFFVRMRYQPGAPCNSQSRSAKIARLRSGR